MKPYQVSHTVVKKYVDLTPDGGCVSSTMSSNTKQCQPPQKITKFIENLERCPEDGQWKSLYTMIPEMKNQSKLLLFNHHPNHNSKEKYVLSVSSNVLLKLARHNLPVLGIDGKHGLQVNQINHSFFLLKICHFIQKFGKTYG